eukprot:3251090-Amphidinium_carterae.2
MDIIMNHATEIGQGVKVATKFIASLAKPRRLITSHVDHPDGRLDSIDVVLTMGEACFTVTHLLVLA